MTKIILLVSLCLTIITTDVMGGLFRRRCRSNRNRSQVAVKLPGYASPEAVWKARENAIANNDWKICINAMSPDRQFYASLSSILEAIERGEKISVDYAKELLAVHKQYGIDLKKIERDLAKISDLPDSQYHEKLQAYWVKMVRSIQDHGSYYSDLAKIVYKYEPEEALDYTGYKPAPLTKLKINNDKAHGYISRDDEKLEAHFVRVDGRWYFSSEESLP